MDPKLKITTSASTYQIELYEKYSINFNTLSKHIHNYMRFNDENIFKSIEYFPAMYGSDVYQTISISDKDISRRKVSKGKTDKNFRNQMLISLICGRSVKVFTNGCIHLIGFKTVPAILKIIEEMLKIIALMFDDGVIDQVVYFDKLRFCSINGVYETGKTVDPSKFHDIELNLEKYYNLATYSNAKHLKVIY